VVEFAAVMPLALAFTLAVVQLGMMLYQRNVIMGSLSEGARVAAAHGRTIDDGRARAVTLIRQSAGAGLVRAIRVSGQESGGIVVLHAEGHLPGFLHGVPQPAVRMTARMHAEDAFLPTATPRSGP
jgi:TadE-like protein